MKFSIKDFFSKCDQIRSLLRIWSHLLKKPLMENFVLCVVYYSSTFVFVSCFYRKNSAFQFSYSSIFFRLYSHGIPVDTGRKLNAHKMFRRGPGRLMYVQFTSCVYGDCRPLIMLIGEVEVNPGS